MGGLGDEPVEGKLGAALQVGTKRPDSGKGKERGDCREPPQLNQVAGTAAETAME